MNITDPATRRYLYGVAVALILLAQGLRLVPGEHVELIVNVVTAVLGIASPVLAIPNTPGRHEA